MCKDKWYSPSEEGMMSWLLNKPLKENPYQFGTADYDSWVIGWRKLEELSAAIAKTKGNNK